MYGAHTKMEYIRYHPTAAGGGSSSLVPEHLRDIESPISPETGTGLEFDTVPPLSTDIPACATVFSIFDAPKFHYERGTRGEKILVIDS